MRTMTPLHDISLLVNHVHVAQSLGQDYVFSQRVSCGFDWLHG